KDALTHTRLRAGRGRRHGDFRTTAENVQECRGLEPGFTLLLLGYRVVEQCGSDSDLRFAVLQMDGAQREPSVHVAVKTHQTDRAAVPSARRFLVVLQELHSPGFR